MGVSKEKVQEIVEWARFVAGRDHATPDHILYDVEEICRQHLALRHNDDFPLIPSAPMPEPKPKEVTWDDVQAIEDPETRQVLTLGKLLGRITELPSSESVPPDAVRLTITPQPKEGNPVTEPQSERISLTQEQYAKLSGFEVLYLNLEEILDPLRIGNESPIDALKRVVAERDELKEKLSTCEDYAASQRIDLQRLKEDCRHYEKEALESRQAYAELKAEMTEFEYKLRDYMNDGEDLLDVLNRLTEERRRAKRDSAALLDTVTRLRNNAEEYTKNILEHEQTIASLNKSVSGFENGYKRELQSRRELEDGIEEALKNFQRDDESFLEAVVRLAEEYGERGEELSAAWDEMPTELINGKTMGECIAILVSGFNRKKVEIARLNAELEKIRDVSGATRLQSTANAVKELKEWCRYIERAHSETSRDLSVDRDSAIRQRDKLAVERDELKAELDRLNARFTEVQAESKQPPLPREIARVHSNLCRALELLPKGEHQKAAILICSSLEELGELIFNWQERTEVIGNE